MRRGVDVRATPRWPHTNAGVPLGGLILAVEVRDSVACRLPRSKPEDEVGGCAGVVAATVITEPIGALTRIAAVVPRRVSKATERVVQRWRSGARRTDRSAVRRASAVAKGPKRGGAMAFANTLPYVRPDFRPKKDVQATTSA